MNKPFIIGIAGGSGSGKTFFLKCFLKHFSENWEDGCADWAYSAENEKEVNNTTSAFM